MVPKVIIHQVRVKGNWIKDGSVEAIRIQEGLQGAHPNATAQAVGALQNHDPSWDMNDLKMTVEANL
jgi:hypothetical protein